MRNLNTRGIYCNIKNRRIVVFMKLVLITLSNLIVLCLLGDIK